MSKTLEKLETINTAYSSQKLLYLGTKAVIRKFTVMIAMIPQFHWTPCEFTSCLPWLWGGGIILLTIISIFSLMKALNNYRLDLCPNFSNLFKNLCDWSFISWLLASNLFIPLCHMTIFLEWYNLIYGPSTCPLFMIWLIFLLKWPQLIWCHENISIPIYR